MIKIQHLIIVVSILISGVVFSQESTNFDIPSLEGEFKVKQIIPGKQFYYINVVNTNGDKILILQDKPTKRVLRKHKFQLSKLEIGETYFLKLQNETFSFGCYTTGAIITEDDVEIWNGSKSDYMVCSADNLLGKFYISEIKLFKFETKTGELIFINTGEIESVDLENGIVRLKKKAIDKFNKENLQIKNAYYCLNKDNWKKLQIIPTRSSNRKEPFNYIFLHNNSLFFYSNNSVMVEGDFLKRMVKAFNISVKK